MSPGLGEFFERGGGAGLTAKIPSGKADAVEGLEIGWALADQEVKKLGGLGFTGTGMAIEARDQGIAESGKTFQAAE